MKLSLIKCKKKLTILWFSCGGIIIILLFCQTILGHYESESTLAWGWALPTIMPTLSLIIGVMVSDTLTKQKSNKKKIDSFIYHLAICLSIIYLLCVLFTILLEPFSERTPSEVFMSASLWLGPFQGLVTAALGAFFVRDTSVK